MGPALVVAREDLSDLVPLLQQSGYPAAITGTFAQGAIAYAPIQSFEELPAGWTMEQDAGRVRRSTQARQHGVRTCSRRAELEALAASTGADALHCLPGERTHRTSGPMKWRRRNSRSSASGPVTFTPWRHWTGFFPDAAIPDAPYAAMRASTVVIAVNCGTPQDLLLHLDGDRTGRRPSGRVEV